MLQSYSVLAVVNIDAGFVAGVFAARICEPCHSGMQKRACYRIMNGSTVLSEGCNLNGAQVFN
jgi:hypothetical protein